MGGVKKRALLRSRLRGVNIIPRALFSIEIKSDTVISRCNCFNRIKTVGPTYLSRQAMKVTLAISFEVEKKLAFSRNVRGLIGSSARRSCFGGHILDIVCTSECFVRCFAI